MSYHFTGVGAEQDPFKLFETKLTELRQGKAEEAAGTRPPTPLSKISWWCWDHPGFKDCHPLSFRAAQADCEAQGKRNDMSCIVPLADHYSMNACPCPKAPPSPLFSAVTGPTWLLIGVSVVGAAVMFGGKKKASA
jgi:hypothetical protein